MTDETRRHPLVTLWATSEETGWVRHAAELRGLSVPEYVKEAINARLRKEGVDAEDEPQHTGDDDRLDLLIDIHNFLSELEGEDAPTGDQLADDLAAAIESTERLHVALAAMIKAERQPQPERAERTPLELCERCNMNPRRVCLGCATFAEDLSPGTPPASEPSARKG